MVTKDLSWEPTRFVAFCRVLDEFYDFLCSFSSLWAVNRLSLEGSIVSWSEQHPSSSDNFPFKVPTVHRNQIIPCFIHSNRCAARLKLHPHFIHFFHPSTIFQMVSRPDAVSARGCLTFNLRDSTFLTPVAPRAVRIASFLLTIPSISYLPVL